MKANINEINILKLVTNINKLIHIAIGPLTIINENINEDIPTK